MLELLAPAGLDIVTNVLSDGEICTIVTPAGMLVPVTVCPSARPTVVAGTVNCGLFTVVFATTLIVPLMVMGLLDTFPVMVLVDIVMV